MKKVIILAFGNMLAVCCLLSQPIATHDLGIIPSDKVTEVTIVNNNATATTFNFLAIKFTLTVGFDISLLTITNSPVIFSELFELLPNATPPYIYHQNRNAELNMILDAGSYLAYSCSINGPTNFRPNHSAKLRFTPRLGSGFNKISYIYDKMGNCISRTIALGTKSALNANDTYLPEIPQNIVDKEMNIIVYPNPTQDRIKIQLLGYGDFDNEQMEFILLDLSGKILFKQKKQGLLVELDLSAYPDGIYILQMHRKGKYESWRVIKKN